MRLRRLGELRLRRREQTFSDDHAGLVTVARVAALASAGCCPHPYWGHATGPRLQIRRRCALRARRGLDGCGLVVQGCQMSFHQVHFV